VRGRITLSTLKDLPSTRKGQKRTFLWDTQVRKFGAYRTSTGDVVFVYQFRMHASQPTERLTIGKLGSLTPDQARSLAASAALKVLTGINPVAERRTAFAKVELDESLLLRNFVQHYMTNEIEAKGRRSAGEIRTVLVKDVCAHLGDHLITDITVPMVEKMLAILSQRSASASRRALIQLKAMLNYAKRSQRIDKVAIEMMKPVLPPERERELSTREIRRFAEAAHDLGGPRGDAYLCLLRLIKRVNEVADMEWREIDQEKWLWRLPPERSKNGEPQEIILPPAVISIIQRQQPVPHLREGFVFTLDGVHAITLGTKMKDAIDAHIHRRMELAAAAGRPMPSFDRYVIHDLRTTGASIMQDLEPPIPPHVIEAALHHISGKTSVQKKYQRRQYVTQVGRALVQLEEVIDNIITDEDAWPGGRVLHSMTKKEITARTAAFRAAWPKKRGKDGELSDSG
jgi:integrase